MILDYKINFPHILGYYSLYLSGNKSAFCLTESAKYICLQIFEFPAGWRRHSLGTAKIAYIGKATENNVTVRLVRWTSRIIRAARFCTRRTLSSTSLLHEVHTVLAYIIRGLITALK